MLPQLSLEACEAADAYIQEMLANAGPANEVGIIPDSEVERIKQANPGYASAVGSILTEPLMHLLPVGIGMEMMAVFIFNAYEKQAEIDAGK